MMSEEVISIKEEAEMSFGKANVYENIVNELKRLIEVGVIKSGEKLPSVRIYAVEHRVNPNTVAKAYAALEADGYLRVQPKQGAFVCYGDGEQVRVELPDGLEKQLSVWRQAGVTKARLEQALAQVYGGDEV